MKQKDFSQVQTAFIAAAYVAAIFALAATKFKDLF
jgi:hypothetical protein